MSRLLEWKQKNASFICDAEWSEHQDQFDILVLKLKELADSMCDAKEESRATRRRNVWNGDARDSGNPLLKELEWHQDVQGRFSGLQYDLIKTRIECPTPKDNMYASSAQSRAAALTARLSIANPDTHNNNNGGLFDGELPAPAIRQGQPVAFIYDGKHSAVDLLTHDAQNCEYLVDSCDGTWHRCRPVMPGGQKAQLAQAAVRMRKAVEEVDANIQTFAENASHSTARHNFVEVGPHPDELLHTLSVKSQKSITRVASFLKDRHGHRNPTDKGMHQHHE
jgi:hypothetical protein